MNKKDLIVISAVGLDQPGVIARVTGLIAEMDGNIQDISQNIMQNLFAVIMTVDITRCQCDFAIFKDRFEQLGDEIGSKIIVQHQDTFRYMHRI